MLLDVYSTGTACRQLTGNNSGNIFIVNIPFIVLKLFLVLTAQHYISVPGIVPMFEVREVGSHHFRLAWSPPVEPNGIITGYVIGFQEGKSNVHVFLIQSRHVFLLMFFNGR